MRSWDVNRAGIGVRRDFMNFYEIFGWVGLLNSAQEDFLNTLENTWINI